MIITSPGVPVTSSENTSPLVIFRTLRGVFTAPPALTVTSILGKLEEFQAFVTEILLSMVSIENGNGVPRVVPPYAPSTPASTKSPGVIYVGSPTDSRTTLQDQ